MTKGFRDIDLPIDDRTLVDLEGLTKDDIVRTLRIALPPMVATRVINRLHNKRHQKQAKTIKAFQLTGQGFEPMAEIDIDVNEFSAHGQITNAVDIGNADSIAVTILGKNHRETTYLVGREDPVRIWKKDNIYGRIVPPAPDYDKVVEHGFLKASYIAEHLSTFFGKRMSIKYGGTGVLKSVEVRADDPDAFHFTLGICQKIRVKKDGLVHVYKTLEEAVNLTVPNDLPDYTVDAYSLAVGDKIQYRGMTVQLKPGLKGKLTQVQLDNEGKVLFVIDGIIYKRNRSHHVKLWRQKEN